MQLPGIPRKLLIHTLQVGLLLALATSRAEAQPLTFILDAPSTRLAEAQLIVAQLAEAGIHAEVKTWDKSELREAARKGLRRAYLTDWGSSFFDPFDLAMPKLSTGAPGNYSIYSNPHVDKLLAAASSCFQCERREQDYQEVQEIIHQQAPWVFGYTLPRFEGVSTAVQGYVPALDGRVALHDVRLVDGNTLTVALDTSAFLSLDPAAYRGRETETMIRNLFDGLVTRTPEGKVVMELAESYEQPDPTTYLFTLRRGPRFHDGSAVTVEDVVFTFERILNPYGLDGTPSPRRDLLGPLRRVEAAGADQVRFVFDRPFPLFLQALVHFQIVSKRCLQQAGGEGFALHPIGTGPFRFVSGTLNTGIVMERFADYYGGSPDLPPIGAAQIQRVIFRPVPDPGERAAALLGGTAQIVQEVPIDEVEAIRLDPAFRILSVEGTRSYQIELNNALPPFNDIRARKALSLAIDWQAVLNQVYHGYGQPLATCFLPSGFGYHAGLTPPGRNIDAARQLLEEAGYGMARELPHSADGVPNDVTVGGTKDAD
jgi:peptide/nickel transport system substrate-binding protein